MKLLFNKPATAVAATVESVGNGPFVVQALWATASLSIAIVHMRHYPAVNQMMMRLMKRRPPAK